jgi:hypothetical protein
MNYMPPAFQDFAARVQEQLPRAGNRAVELLRWRSGELGPQRPFASGRQVSWRLGHGEWQSFPGSTALTIDHTALLEISPQAHADLQHLLSAGQTEPFAYELVREAWAVRTTSPRTALLIAITALEVAVKQYIAARVEAATWLVNNLPSPDVISLLRDYLPTLEPPPAAPPSASKLDPLPGDLVELLKKRRNQRNDLIHRPEAHVAPKPRITPERATSAVLAVRQVFLRLDIANGQTWCCDFLEELPNRVPPSGYRRVQ